MNDALRSCVWWGLSQGHQVCFSFFFLISKNKKQKRNNLLTNKCRCLGFEMDLVVSLKATFVLFVSRYPFFSLTFFFVFFFFVFFFLCYFSFVEISRKGCSSIVWHCWGVAWGTTNLPIRRLQCGLSSDRLSPNRRPDYDWRMGRLSNDDRYSQ